MHMQEPGAEFSMPGTTSHTASLLLCVSPAVPVLLGRTALQVYRELMVSFQQQFAGQIQSTITDIDVGLGPKGELRYPSMDDRWAFPGIGEFQVRTAAERDLCFKHSPVCYCWFAGLSCTYAALLPAIQACFQHPSVACVLCNSGHTWKVSYAYMVAR
jgi:hypothetical protein